MKERFMLVGRRRMNDESQLGIIRLSSSIPMSSFSLNGTPLWYKNKFMFFLLSMSTRVICLQCVFLGKISYMHLLSFVNEHLTTPFVLNI